MATCKADPSIERVVVDSFTFPLGVYPVETMTPSPGYTVEFEPADGDDEEGDWEEWPDRYVYDIVISAHRLEALCHRLFSLLPGRIYPILDVLGHDAYREIDPYISYDLIGLDRFLDTLRRYHDFFFEDGLCGFGAMSEQPFVYLFVDEHKIITVRVEPSMKERLDRLLETFDLEPSSGEVIPAGADSASHEHRSVLLAPPDKPDLLSTDEIVERLRDDWELLLNVDPEGNVDEQGRELGVTSWRVIARCEVDISAEPLRYAEVLLYAGCLRRAEEIAADAVLELAPKPVDYDIATADRLGVETLREAMGEAGAALEDEGAIHEEGVIVARWIDDTPQLSDRIDL